MSAKKTKEPATDKNHIKGVSYKVAFERIKKANEEGFYFEVITLCESIISDRLQSYASGVGSPKPKKARESFYDLIEACQKYADKSASAQETIDLMAALDVWRRKRNEAVHQFAKSLPGEPTVEVEVALGEAKAAAKQGASLARKVCNWHGKNLRLARKANPAS